MALLKTGQLRAEDLRRKFLAAGAGNRSLPAFYQFMGRLENEGYISARRRQLKNGHFQTTYRLLKKGQDIMKSTVDFYVGWAA
jgi:DNA-binding PadR family transcriptional regulator